MDRFCSCKDCKNQRKFKGKVLGSRRMGFWYEGVYQGLTMCSDYVRHHKFVKGRARKERKFNFDMEI